MKYISRDGLLWVKEEKSNVLVGLTGKGISHYGMFQVFIPRVKNGSVVKKKQMLVSTESNNTLTAIRSCFDGKVVINQDFVDAPFDICQESVLYTVVGPQAGWKDDFVESFY